MMHFILLFLESTLPGFVVAGFVVLLIWQRLFSKKQ